jgi:hypothetical protein
MCESCYINVYCRYRATKLQRISEPDKTIIVISANLTTLYATCQAEDMKNPDKSPRKVFLAESPEKISPEITHSLDGLNW